MMRRNSLAVRIIAASIAWCALSVSSVVWAQDVQTTPTLYQLTMKKLELCPNSTCVGPTLLVEKDQAFDIASAAAGQAVGSYVDAVALQIGKTFTHMRVTVDRAFTLTGSATSGVTNGGNAGACFTDGTVTGTAGTVNSIAMTSDSNADGRGSVASAMTLVVPNADDASNGPNFPDLNATFSAAGISIIDATTLTVTIALANPFTVTATPPTITVNFDVADTLDMTGTAADACALVFEAPTVTISIQ